MTKDDDLQFDRWMQTVDLVMRRRFVVGVHDLPDYMFRDAFDSEMTPNDVVDDIWAKFQADFKGTAQ